MEIRAYIFCVFFILAPWTHVLARQSTQSKRDATITNEEIIEQLKYLKEKSEQQDRKIGELKEKNVEQDFLIREQAMKLVSLGAALERKNKSDHTSFTDNKIVETKSQDMNHTDDLRPKMVRSDDLDLRTVRSDDSEDALQTSLDQVIQKVEHQGALITSIQAAIGSQAAGLAEAKRSVYVRWGSHSCPTPASLVYAGVIGGSWFDHSGGATNYLCLTMEPTFNSHVTPSGTNFLFGAEYETRDFHEEKDAVCAVCRAAAATTVMVPGTNRCTSGWHLEYSGYLMAGRHDHSSGSEFVCVDSNLEYAPHGDRDEDGRLLYFTATRCGALPCTPYVNNKIVLCAVCSK